MRNSEKVLYAHLTNPDSLDIISREGFNSEEALEVIPTELGRRIVKWCLDRYFESGRIVAPSKIAIDETFGDQMEKVDIVIIDDVEIDSVQYAIADLRSHYLYAQTEDFSKRMVTEIYNSDAPDRPSAMQKYLAELQGITRLSISRRNEMNGLEGTDDAIFRLKQRIADGETIIGMRFGLPELDRHTGGIRPGEICTVAAGPGTGKSWLAGYVTNAECFVKRRALLVTLENDIEMTFDRLVCMAAGVPYDKFQKGDLNESEMGRVGLRREIMAEAERAPIVTQMSNEEPTPTAIVRRAQLEGADSIILDQTSHIRPERGSRAIKRSEQLTEIMRGFNDLLRDEYKVPLLLLNQINREGRAAARKSGRYEMEHLADGGAVEQASAHVFTIFQSDLMRREQRAQIQQLKARRTDRAHFDTVWRPEVGDIRIKRQVQLDDAS